MRTKLSLAAALLLVLLVGCQSNTPAPTRTPDQQGIANPAAQYCVEHNGTVEIRTDTSGGQYGVCVFEDGSECEEWAYSRGDCQPGQNDTAPAPTSKP